MQQQECTSSPSAQVSRQGVFWKQHERSASVSEGQQYSSSIFARKQLEGSIVLAKKQVSAASTKRDYDLPLQKSASELRQIMAVRDNCQAAVQAKRKRLDSQAELLREQRELYRQQIEKRKAKLAALSVEVQVQELLHTLILRNPQRVARLQIIRLRVGDFERSIAKLHSLFQVLPQASSTLAAGGGHTSDNRKTNVAARAVQEYELGLKQACEEKCLALVAIFEALEEVRTLRERRQHLREDIEARTSQNSELACEYEELETILEEIVNRNPIEFQIVREKIESEGVLQTCRTTAREAQTQAEKCEQELLECEQQLQSAKAQCTEAQESLTALRTALQHFKQGSTKQHSADICQATTGEEVQPTTAQDENTQQEKEEDEFARTCIEDTGLPYWREIVALFKQQPLQLQRLLLEEVQVLAACQGMANVSAPLASRLQSIQESKKKLAFENDKSSGFSSTQRALFAVDQLFLNVRESLRRVRRQQSSQLQLQQQQQQQKSAANSARLEGNSPLRALLEYLAELVERCEQEAAAKQAIAEWTQRYMQRRQTEMSEELKRERLQTALQNAQARLRSACEAKQRAEEAFRERDLTARQSEMELCEEYYARHLEENGKYLRDMRFKFGKAYCENMQLEIRNSYFERIIADRTNLKAHIQRILARKTQISQARTRIAEAIEHDLGAQYKQLDIQINNIQRQLLAKKHAVRELHAMQRSYLQKIKAVASKVLNEDNKQLNSFLQQHFGGDETDPLTAVVCANLASAEVCDLTSLSTMRTQAETMRSEIANLESRMQQTLVQLRADVDVTERSYEDCDRNCSKIINAIDSFSKNMLNCDLAREEAVRTVQKHHHPSLSVGQGMVDCSNFSCSSASSSAQQNATAASKRTISSKSYQVSDAKYGKISINFAGSCEEMPLQSAATISFDQSSLNRQTLLNSSFSLSTQRERLNEEQFVQSYFSVQPAAPTEQQPHRSNQVLKEQEYSFQDESEENNVEHAKYSSVNKSQFQQNTADSFSGKVRRKQNFDAEKDAETLAAGVPIYRMFGINKGFVVKRDTFDPVPAAPPLSAASTQSSAAQNQKARTPAAHGYGRRILRCDESFVHIERVCENARRSTECSYKRDAVEFTLSSQSQQILRAKQKARFGLQVAQKEARLQRAEYIPFQLRVKEVGGIDCLAEKESQIYTLSRFFNSGRVV